MNATISAVVEGDLDAAVIRRLAREAGLHLASVHVKRGKQNIRSRISGYNAAAQHTPFVVLVDLDREYDCAPELIREWLPERASLLRFRVAVRAIEAWLLGDRERVARFLRVKQSSIPVAPETALDPKRTLVEIARHSTNADVRADLVPRAGSGRTVGEAYSARLIAFVTRPDGWRSDVAAERCDSLARAKRALTDFAAAARLVAEPSENPR